MQRTRLPLVVASGGMAVGIAILPTVAAAGYDSTAESLIRTLGDELIFLAVAVALVVEVALLYGVLRYRNSGRARPTEYNPRFLFTYVLAVGVILLFVGVASFQTLAVLEQERSQPPPEGAVRVDVTAQQWAWEFEYADANVSSVGTLVIPVDRPVYLNLTSRDVIHSLHVPSLGVKRDANPGMWNSITFTPTETGTHRVFCAEYCGVGHSAMLGTVRVVDGAEYDRWLDEQRGNSTEN